MTLEERIERLESIEEIRSLQSKYQRFVDTRKYDELSKIVTSDVITNYDNGNLHFEGKEALINFLSSSMTLEMPSSHLIHGGEIDIISPTEAKAIWTLEDLVIAKKYGITINGMAYYEVKYIKVDNSWLIKEIGYTRNFEYMKKITRVMKMTLKKETYLDELKKENKKNKKK